MKQKQSVMAAQDSRDTRRPRADADLESKVRRSSLNVRATRLLPQWSAFTRAVRFMAADREHGVPTVCAAPTIQSSDGNNTLDCTVCCCCRAGPCRVQYHACGPEQEHISSSALVFFFFWFCFCHATLINPQGSQAKHRPIINCVSLVTRV